MDMYIMQKKIGRHICIIILIQGTGIQMIENKTVQKIGIEVVLKVEMVMTFMMKLLVKIIGMSQKSISPYNSVIFMVETSLLWKFQVINMIVIALNNLLADGSNIMNIILEQDIVYQQIYVIHSIVQMEMMFGIFIAMIQKKYCLVPVHWLH